MRQINGFLANFLFASLVLLGNVSIAAEDPKGFVAKIQAHTPDEVASILKRADKLVDEQGNLTDLEPIALILHGQEANAFLRENYGVHKELVDLAAKLDAFDVVDIQVCEAWMSMNKISEGELPAFVNTVPYGPREEKRLLGTGYIYF